jgi:hypothetical protein
VKEKTMNRQPYKSEKRRKEIARQKKQEEKRLKRQEKKRAKEEGLPTEEVQSVDGAVVEQGTEPAAEVSQDGEAEKMPDAPEGSQNP